MHSFENHKQQVNSHGYLSLALFLIEVNELPIPASQTGQLFDLLSGR